MPIKTLLTWMLTAAVVVTLLAGCGRKRDLEVPGVHDAQGRPVHTSKQPPVRDRHFILDPLIQ